MGWVEEVGFIDRSVEESRKEELGWSIQSYFFV
jgi:hypothetical protein